VRHNLRVAGCLVLLGLVLPGCLYVTNGPSGVTGPPGAAFDNYDAGDPAAVNFPPGNSAIQVYTSNEGWDPTSPKNIPMWTTNVAPSVSIASFRDALPTLPNWATPLPNPFTGIRPTTSVVSWAPSVIQWPRTAQDANDYLMSFAEQDTTGGPNGPMCIGFAYSTNGPNNPFSALPFEYCGGANNDIDPYLWVDSNGNQMTLLFSNQGSNPPAPNNSAIWSQALNISGVGSSTSISWSAVPQEILTLPAANFIASKGDSTFNGGALDRVENPAVVWEAGQGFDVTASVGTYNGLYWTVEELCGLLTAANTCSGTTYLNSGGSSGLGYLFSHWGSASFLKSNTSTNEVFGSLCYGQCLLDPFSPPTNYRFEVNYSVG